MMMMPRHCIVISSKTIGSSANLGSCSVSHAEGLNQDQFIAMSTEEEKVKEDKNNQLESTSIIDDDESIRIVSPIEDEHLPQVCQVLEDSFSTKRCLCVFNINETLPELQRRYAKMKPAKRALGAIALDSTQGRVLGYVQMATGGMTTFPMNLHDVRVTKCI